MRDFSSWGERGETVPAGARATHAFQKVCFRTVESGMKKDPSRDMVDRLSFCID